MIALLNWVAKLFMAVWLGVVVVPLGNSIALATFGKLWARSAEGISDLVDELAAEVLREWDPLPALSTDRRFTGVVLK